MGPGRVGGAFARVLGDRGWDMLVPLGRHDDVAGAAQDTDLVLIATPDRSVRAGAAAIQPSPTALIVHVAGSLGLDVLGAHERRGALHPLVSIPDAELGAVRLVDGAWFAFAADYQDDEALLTEIVTSLGGHAVSLADSDRAQYHAAATIASNHLVALFGQVARVAEATGVPLEAFLGLASQTLDGLGELAPAEALTGPVQRGDWDTVARHLEALGVSERPAYAALAEAAARLVAERGGAGEPADAADTATTPPSWLVDARRGDDGTMNDPDEAQHG